jgi:hydroxymethylpyrimidine pyrophosphatase-like HAD family hydrolase
VIKLFVSDIDGCISEPFVPFDLETLGEIRALAATGSMTGVPLAPPEFTLCTGRPLGYAEAVGQALGVRLPILFEAGAGMYNMTTGVRTWHPSFGPSEASARREIQDWLETLVPGTSMAVDRGKYTQAGLIGADAAEIAAALETVSEFVGTSFPDFRVAYTEISVDVMHKDLTKREGLAWLAQELGLELDELAFIGDTNGDLGGLRAVGSSFAPANGSAEVRQTVGTVTTGAVCAGVLEAYRICVDRNNS